MHSGNNEILRKMAEGITLGCSLGVGKEVRQIGCYQEVVAIRTWIFVYIS